MQQKLKREISWTWTPGDSKIVQNFKKMYKNLHVLNLPNEGDDLILRQTPTMSIGVQYSKSKKEKNFANITVEVLIKQNTIILRWKKKFLQS